MTEQQVPHTTMRFQSFTDAMMQENNVLIGISELAKATGVTPAQLRYWLAQGYIQSAGEDKKNKFTFSTVFKVRSIKIFQSEGYTLAAAAKHAAQYSTLAHKIKQIISDRLISVNEDGSDVIIDFGPFDPNPDHHLIARVATDKTTFELN
ncbi:MerR family transcriptional regulator [Leuconostoc fallax]|uniref:HTH merR-type domain-containing protein n=1 Tax=Leuconostoc fallax TaxID=1251 RepID=A0A4R5N7U9_9LACO|nr:MerR family transcriptional regulator [Leuconostoc fallax]MBU7455777.1 MerR family transcriptional regulator [Leuconostoc fallax]MCO6183978.1 MerR family transcriptional regulator [Leuconostoc fallax]TDG67983.1 hypothetical protein C5L23_000289 [Leuconostoc fallax]